jgi:hypothetical protein
MLTPFVQFDPVGSPELLARRLNEAVQAGAQSVLVLASDGVAWPAEQVTPCLTALPVPVFGGVFPQVVFGTQHSETGLIVAAVDGAARVNVVPGLNDAAVDFAEALEPVEADGPTVLVLVDGLASRIARFIEAVFDHIGGGPVVLGGGAGSLSFVPRPCLFTPQGLLSGVGVVVSLERPMAIGVNHGWEPIAGPFVVTRTEGNTVQQLSYRPASDVYRECVEPRVGERLTAENFFGHAKGHPFGIERFDGSLLVRDPIVMKDSDLVCVGEVPEQTAVRILCGDADRLIEAAARGTRQAIDGLGRRPAGALLIDCISRVLFLGDRFGEELAAAQQQLVAHNPEARPLVGVLTLGEIANNGTRCLEFYNKTFVLGAYGDV